MADFGAWLAPRLRAADVILIDGPLGAGKTHLARSVIAARLAALGLAEDIPSPTFTLLQTYEAGALTIVHADLYRLGSPGEVAELGLDELFGAALCLVEWPGRLGPYLPDTALTMRISPGPDEHEREVTLAATAPRWSELTAGVLRRWTRA